MADRCERAVAAETRPEVVAWVRRLKRLVRDMPDGVRVYATNNAVSVTDDCMDAGEDSVAIQRHEVEDIYAPRWNGGDW